MNKRSSLLIFALAAWPALALADRCEELATPTEFTADSAMEAVFCQYDRSRKATLLPLEHTRTWNSKQAEIVATPLLTATYRENGERKGVIAVQRQQLNENGEPVMSHATGAIIWVYLFRHDGSRWVFEKGKKEALYAGAHGHAPGGRLMRLGPGKHGLWFKGGDVHQGYTEDYAFVVPLSEANILPAGPYFDTGKSNAGACSEDEQERQGLGLRECWSYEGQPELIERENSDYYILRIRYQGTGPDDKDWEKIVSKDRAVCYEKSTDKYLASSDTKCADYKAVDEDKVFDADDTGEGTQPIPSMPRKLLK